MPKSTDPAEVTVETVEEQVPEDDTQKPAGRLAERKDIQKSGVRLAESGEPPETIEPAVEPTRG